MNPKTLAVNIRRLRESKHLKQEYVAEQIGVSSATYSKIENGKTSLSAVRLQQIAHVLQVSVNALLTNNTSSVSTGKSLADCNTALLVKEQLILEKDMRIAELERERNQSLEREQRLLNYIKMLEQQTV